MFKVYIKRCNECLFSDNKIVEDRRREEVIKDCFKKDTWFICHKSSMIGGKTCCKGFYDKYRQEIKDIRIAIALGIVQFEALPLQD